MENNNDGQPIFCKDKDFDEIMCKRINKLICLENKCLCLGKQLNINYDIINIHSANFYTTVADLLKPFILYLINDEISACLEERGPIQLLETELFKYVNQNERSDFVSGLSEIQNTFFVGLNFIYGSLSIDLTIHMFSAFEFYISKLYEFVKNQYTHKNLKRKRLEKYLQEYHNIILEQEKCCINNRLKEYNEKIESLKNKIMTNCSSYVSGKEKIDFIISKIENYSERSLDKDIEIINFLHMARNTVHNLGNNAGKDTSLQVNGNRVSLPHGKKMDCTDYIVYIDIFGELVDIYKAITQSFNIIDSECLFVTE